MGRIHRDRQHTEDKDQGLLKSNDLVQAGLQAHPLTVETAMNAPGRLTPRQVLALQHAVGNRAVQRLVAPTRREAVTTSRLVQRHISESAAIYARGAVDRAKEVSGAVAPAKKASPEDALVAVRWLAHGTTDMLDSLERKR
jgi:hypothetical protein